MQQHHLEIQTLDETATRRAAVAPPPRLLFHNAAMPDHDSTAPAIDKRLTDLEVKASFTEDLVDHLNDLVARQQEQIDLLIREVGKLKDRGPDTGGAARDPRDEVPPHS